MSFSSGQQPEFRQLVARAWEVACAGMGLTLADAKKEGKAFYRAWYEDELEKGTGKRSTKECDRKRDYERAMAHFEGIAGESIRWQMRAMSGDKRRVLHEIRVCAGRYREHALREAEGLEEFDVDEGYLLGIAEKALGVRPAALDRLEAEQLAWVLVSLKRQLARQARRGQACDTVRRAEAEEGEIGRRGDKETLVLPPYDPAPGALTFFDCPEYQQEGDPF